MRIHVDNSQRALPLTKAKIRALVQKLASHLGVEQTEASIYFVSAKAISALHEQFFKDPTPTDCISFPGDAEHLGEIFVCPAIALKYAAKHQLDPYEELSLYMIHGILHCLGFDDIAPSDRRAMRKKEKSCMHFLKRHGLLLRRP